MPKPLDEQLIAALCRDGRADVRDIAATTDAVPTTIQKHLRELEENGVIRGYTARVDYSHFGYETVIFRLGVELDAVDDVTERLRDRKQFVTVYQMSDTDTVFAVGKFGTEAAVAACLRELHDDSDIRRVDTNTVVSVRQENGCPLSEY
ncbi:MAG: winged helix-turn-helix transcriptional regulator [Natronomonas sp.]